MVTMNYLMIGTFLLIFIGIQEVVAQRQYAIGFMHMGSKKQVEIMQSHLLISTSGKASFQVALPTLNRPINISLDGGKYYKFILDPFEERAILPKKVERAGISILSNEDICVHGISFDFMTYGGFHAQPLMPYSTSFYLPSYSIQSGLSQFLISAGSDSTTVKVNIKEKGEYKNETIIRLQNYETYLFNDPNLDFTGTHVQSDKPIGLFSGVDCGQIPVDIGFCDTIVVGVPPVKSLGKRFIVAPLADRESYTGYLVRTLVTEDNTIVTNNGENRTLSRGEFLETDAASSSYIMDITCSHPCMVSQYSKGSKTDNTHWDPFMMIVPPLKDYSNKQIWSNAMDRHGLSMLSFANIVAPADKTDGIVVDGKKVTSPWNEVPGGEFKVTSYVLYMGVHQAWHTDGVTKIGVTTYGRGTKESIAYGYPACASGSKFKTGDSKDKGSAGTQGETTCGSDPAWIQQCCSMGSKWQQSQSNPDSSGGDPRVAGSSSCKPVSNTDHLQPLWYVLCALAGAIVGVLLTLLVIWCRVRHFRRVVDFIFNPCSTSDDAMEIKMTEA